MVTLFRKNLIGTKGGKMRPKGKGRGKSIRDEAGTGLESKARPLCEGIDPHRISIKEIEEGQLEARDDSIAHLDTVY
jgi:hypothetical protein